MVGVRSDEGIVAVGVVDDRLPASALEVVQGIVLGFTDQGDLVGLLTVNEISTERRHQLAYKVIQMGMALLEGKLQVH